MVADALERFLAERESPASPEDVLAQIARIDQGTSEREAIEAMRAHAAAILEIAARVMNRKGPKSVASRAQRHRGKRTA